MEKTAMFVGLESTLQFPPEEQLYRIRLEAILRTALRRTFMLKNLFLSVTKRLALRNAM